MRVCHSDALTKDGVWPGIVYPRAAGHEVVGIIDALGGETDPWAEDSEDALKFAAANGVRPMIETFPLERAADAYEHMLSGKMRFRSVLKI